MEHVLADGGALRYVQRISDPTWTLVYGCHLTREPQLHIRAAGFQHVELEEFDAVELLEPFSLLLMDFCMVRSHISGTATK